MKLVIPIALLAAACGTESSSSLLTSGMSADTSAAADGTGNTEVTAELFAGSPLQLIYVELQDGDQLIAHHGAASQVMQEQRILTIVGYTAVFPGTTDGDEFSVELVRDVDDGAPDSSMTTPASFELDPIEASYSRAGEIAVSWGPTTTNSAETMSWSVTGVCVQAAGGSLVGDPGAVTIPANAIQPTSASDASASCDAQLQITRSRGGSLDPAYGHGGTADGEQVRTLTFTTAP